MSSSNGIDEPGLAAIYSWCLKWHMRLTPKKTKSMVVSWLRAYAPAYGDLTLGGVELEEVKNLRIFGKIVNSKLTFATHLCDGVS